jgi:hypothetical protein
VDAIATEISSFREEVNARFDRVDQQGATIERRVDRVENNLHMITRQTAVMS